MKNKITVTGANITFFVFSAAFIMFQFLLVIPAMFYKDVNKFAIDNFVWITLISEYVIIMVPVIVFVLVKKLDIKEVFRFNNPGLVPCLLIILITPFANQAAGVANNIVIYLLNFFGSVPNPPIPTPGNPVSLIVTIFVIAVTPAICEELLNRGIMMKAYENRGTYKAIVISAIMFGVFHFSIINFFGPVILGLLIGYYVVKTNSIFAGMLAHFLNNAFSVVLMCLQKGETPDRITITLPELVQTVVVGIGAALIALALLWLFSKATKNRGTIKPSVMGIGEDILSIISHWPIIVVICLYIFMTFLTLVEIFVS